MTLVAEAIGSSMDTEGGLSHFYASYPKITGAQDQYCHFQLNVGNAFLTNPVQHVYVILDGHIWKDKAADAKPLQGRGIVIGDTVGATGCALSGFEGFGTTDNGLGNDHPASGTNCGSGFTLNPLDSYKVEVSVNATRITYAIKNTAATVTYYSSSWNLTRGLLQNYDCSNIFIGFTGKEVSDLSFCNVQTGIL